MKLRQKLAVVLAASMALTAVPVITMASTSNKIVKSATILEKDKKTTAASLKVEFEQTPSHVEEFYLELTNAEWLKGNVNDDAGDNADGLTSVQLLQGAGFTSLSEKKWEKTVDGMTIVYRRQSDSTVMVTVTGADDAYADGKKVIELPLAIKATGGEVSVKLTGEGSDSIITEGNYKVMTTGEKAASVSVDSDLKTFYDNGELTKIVLKESFNNSFHKDMILKVQLNDTDFEFKPSDVKIDKTYGFGDGDFEPKYVIDPDDKSTMYIYISKSDVAGSRNSLGRLEITGLLVDNDEKDIKEGKLTADIKSVKYGDLSKDVRNDADFAGIPTDNDAYAELDKEYKDTNVAEITNYGAFIEMKDSKAVNIKAGRQEDVEFTVKEAVDDVFVGNREITLALKDGDDKTDSAFFMVSRDQYNAAEKDAKNSDVISYLVDGDGDSKKVVKSVEFILQDDDDAKYDEESKEYWERQKDVVRVKEIKVTLKDKRDGDTDGLNKNKEKDKFKVKLPVYVPVDKQDKKTIKVTGEMRGVDEFKSADAINVVDPFDVEFTQTTLKVGLQKQVAGNITLKELDKEMLEKGKLVFNIAKGSDANTGIVVDGKGDLTITGDLKNNDFDKSGVTDYVELKRQSKSASSVAIDNMLITVDRTVPEGFYDLELSGAAIDKYNGKYKVEDYIVIGTPNTQDITSAGLTKGISQFVIGESKYSMNGLEYQMDAPSYIQNPGYTMVPVRYVAQAFGVAEKDILFGNGTVTIFAGERTISLTSGSNVATVNGSPVPMGTKVVIKDGRTYAPAGEIARLIGISTTWDAATKTATFENK